MSSMWPLSRKCQLATAAAQVDQQRVLVSDGGIRQDAKMNQASFFEPGR